MLGRARPSSADLRSWLRPDPNRSGRQYALTVLAPVRPGEDRALTEVVEAFAPGPDSPFARVPRLHFARLVVIPKLVWEGSGEPTEQLRNPYLLFSSCATDDLDGHVEALRTAIPAEADAIWSHCVAYPGASDRGAFHTWVRRCQLRTSLFHAGYPDSSVDDVRQAVALRDDLTAYALEAQALTPAAAHSRYLERFGEIS